MQVTVLNWLITIYQELVMYQVTTIINKKKYELVFENLHQVSIFIKNNSELQCFLIKL